MFRHYLMISWRNLFRNKVFALINILGLSVGMGVCLLIYQYVHFEMSYDQFFGNAQNTYRLTQTTFRSGEDLGKGVFTTFGLGPSGKETIPEVKDYARVHDLEIDLVVSNIAENESYLEENLWYVDSTFLKVRDFPLKYGDRESAFIDKYSVVITEEMALKYFGDTNPIGKGLKVSGGVLSGNFSITGVLEQLPANSHLQFDFLLPLANLLENYGQYKNDEGWDWNNFITYVALSEGADLNEVGKKFDELIVSHAGENLAKSNEKWSIGFQPVTDIHLKSDFSRELSSNNGDIQHVYFFSLIALFILLMAWVNYLNLSTAQSLTRAKEVDVRKYMGAMKRQLIIQFMMESAIINFIAAILAILLAILMLPFLNQIIGIQIEFILLQKLGFWCSFLGIIIFGSVISSLYPAFLMSSVKPAGIINIANHKQSGNFSLKKGLVVFQFLISSLLISGTYLVYKQVSFMRNKDLGIDMEQILVLTGPRVILESTSATSQTLGSSYDSFKSMLTSHHSISSVSATSTVPSKGYAFRADVHKYGMTEDSNKEGNLVLADADFINTFGFEFLSATEIPKTIPEWTYAFVNEEAIDTYGLSSPEEALGEELEFLSYRVKILGVLKDVHWNSLKEASLPTLFILDNEYRAYFSIKMSLNDIPTTLSHVEKSFKSTFPEDPFEYFFLDDSFNNQYQSDLQFQNLFFIFSILAVFIACLGLFALVSFSANLRVKEIGIRKVLGANMGSLMLLLSREYIILLGIATLLAIPFILFGASSWLENYAYRIDFGVELIIIPALFLFIVALMTVSRRVYKATNANPTDSLRSE